MRMNIQPRVVGERIDYITEEVKYICIPGGGVSYILNAYKTVIFCAAF